MNPERSCSCQSSQRLRHIGIRHMAMVDMSPIRTDYSRCSTLSTIPIVQTHVLVISLCVSIGTLFEAIAYSLMNMIILMSINSNFMRVYFKFIFRVYFSHPMWNQARCNNVRDRDHNLRHYSSIAMGFWITDITARI